MRGVLGGEMAQWLQAPGPNLDNPEFNCPLTTTTSWYACMHAHKHTPYNKCLRKSGLKREKLGYSQVTSVAYIFGDVRQVFQEHDF